MASRVSENVRAEILKLHAKGKKPLEIFNEVRGLTKGLQKTTVAHVISYYTKRNQEPKAVIKKAPKTTTPKQVKEPTTTDALIVQATSSEIVLKMLHLLAFRENISAETRIAMIQEVLKG